MRRAIAVLLACGLWAAGWAGAGMPPTPVVVAPAVRVEVHKVLPTIGTVQALREVKVSSKLAERVVALNVEEGDEVVKDKTVLCELDATNTKLSIQEAQARVEAARQALAKVEAGLRKEEIEQARAMVDEQKAQLAKLEADVRRARTLREKKVTAEADLVAVVALHDMAKARLAQLQAALDLAVAGSRQEDKDQARAELALRQAELSTARQREKDSAIVSPVDGYVVRKHTEVGQWMQLGGTVVEIVDTSVLRVHTRVTEKNIGRLRRGIKVRIRLDAYPGKTFEGKVHRIVPRADAASRSFPVLVNVEEPKALVKTLVRPGMFARTEFILSSRKGLLMVPEDALIYRGGLVMVFAASPKPPPGTKMDGPPGGDKGGEPPELPGPPMWARRVFVKTGARQDGRIEIVEQKPEGALDAGALVVVVGSENLRDKAMMIVLGGLPQKGKGPGTPAPGKGAPGPKTGPPKE